MLNRSFDVICAVLNDTCPSVPNIYLNREPQDFTRPSFFASLQGSQCSRKGKTLWGAPITWRIVYRGPLGTDSYPDALSEIGTLDLIQDTVMDAGRLTAADGTIYSVQSLAGGCYEDDVQLTITLETSEQRG